MDNGMATKKITITVYAEQLRAIRALVDECHAKSVSAFVQHAIAISLGDVAGWGALLTGVLKETGGPMTKAERAWADGVLAKRGHPAQVKRRRAA